MSSNFDASDFIDSDFQASRKPVPAGAVGSADPSSRSVTREELDSKVNETQSRLAELKRAQDELERERASLEDLRRRQAELQTSREELLHSLTRGVGLLEEAELTKRREVDQMAGVISEFRSAVAKIQGINEQNWEKDNYSIELTRALTVLENARMEWNSARLKFPSLNPEAQDGTAPVNKPAASGLPLGASSMGELCKFGLALTWPIVLLLLSIFVTLVIRR